MSAHLFVARVCRLFLKDHPMRDSWTLTKLASTLFMMSSVIISKNHSGRDSLATPLSQVSSMPNLPRPADFMETAGGQIHAPDPKPNGFFGTCIQVFEGNEKPVVLIGQSNGIYEYTRDPQGDWIETGFIEPPKGCPNPGTFGMSFAVDGPFLTTCRTRGQGQGAHLQTR